MNKLPESLCKELKLSVEAKERLNDYMEKAINEAIERSKKITIKVKIAYVAFDDTWVDDDSKRSIENVKIERELVFDKNDKLEELFWKVNDLLEEEGCELYLGNELSYSYNGEEIWLNEYAEDYYNENVTMVSHFEVDGVLEIWSLDL